MLLLRSKGLGSRKSRAKAEEFPTEKTPIGEPICKLEFCFQYLSYPQTKSREETDPESRRRRCVGTHQQTVEFLLKTTEKR